jgi:Uma2 family endonuclease
VLSPGRANERRDREAKLDLYTRRDVQEYWIVDWRSATLEIYRRQEGRLQVSATLRAGDMVTSPLLPGFTCPLERFFEI